VSYHDDIARMSASSSHHDLKFIDMTGGSTFSQAEPSSLASREKEERKAFPLFDKLKRAKETSKHNLQSVIHSSDYAKSSLVTLEYELKTTGENIIKESEQVGLLKSFKEELKNGLMRIDVSLEKHDFDSFVELGREINAKYPEYYWKYQVGLAIVKKIMPFLKKEFERWDIEGDPMKLFDLFYFIRKLLHDGELKHHHYESGDTDDVSADEIQTYLFESIWIHPMRTFISTRWDPKSFNLFKPLEKWFGLLPD